jgi:NADP-dependent aldehyde dehydrogenase
MEGPSFDTIRDVAKKAAEEAQPSTMLHQGIYDSYDTGLQRLGQIPGVSPLASSNQKGYGRNQAPCHLFEAEIDTLFAHPELKEENFGPSSVFLKAQSIEKLEQAAESMEGQLTATIHGTESDLLAHKRLVEILQRKVGRLIFNGFPTGIEVCPSMHHGGPYPATTHSGFTSIGTASIERFVRPVCYQGFPESALPPELKNKNERGILRLVNNAFIREDVE